MGIANTKRKAGSNQACYEPGHGVNLWVSDGSETGTCMVKDILEGPGSNFIDKIVAVNEKEV